MADTKISALDPLTAPAPDDEFEVRDDSDTSMGAEGTNKRIRYADMVQPALASFDVFGHSYASGGGAAFIDDAFAAKLAALLGSRVRSYAIGGAVGSWPDSGTSPTTAGDGGWNYMYHCRDMSEYGQDDPFLPGPASLIWHGIHDLAKNGPDTNLAPFQHALRAMIARARCGAIFENDHSSVVKGGTWSADATGQTTNSGLGHALSSNTNSTITITVPSSFIGGEIVLGFLAGTDGKGALLDIDVTGATTQTNLTHDTRDINPDDFGTGSNDKIGTSVKILTGLNAGAHSIVISVTTLATTWYFDWWGIVADPKPLVVVGNANSPPAWTTWNTWPYSRNETTLSAQSNIGAITSTVTSATGIVNGDTITFEEGTANEESKRITSLAGSTVGHSATAIQHNNASAVVTGIQAYDVDNDLNPKIEAICNEFDEAVLYWDTEAVLQSNPLYYASDDAHPNDLGHSLLAADLFGLIRNSGLLTPERTAKMAGTQHLSTAITLTRAAAMVIGNNSDTAVDWDTLRTAHPRQSLFHSALFPGRIYFREVGWYRITFEGRWAANATGARVASIRYNGGSYIAAPKTPAAPEHFLVSRTFRFNPGDYIEAMAFQTSGGNLNVLKTADYTPEISVERIR